jgi:hypothetical protein
MRIRFATRHCLAPILVVLISYFAFAAEDESLYKADFRYAPPWWQTSICLPDDWQKTLVGKEGSLLYDWPGEFSGFRTRVTVDLSSKTEWASQELPSPRAPIVRTVKKSGDVEVIEEAFAVSPAMARDRSAAASPGYSAANSAEALDGAERLAFGRVGSHSYDVNWASPPPDSDPAFSSIAVGHGEPIRYRFRAVDSRGCKVVFGLCEGYHAEKGKRVLDLKIEGKTRKTVDPVAEKGKNVPLLYAMDARDENGDGWIDLAVAAAAESADKNPIVNVLWVFGPEAQIDLRELASGRSSSVALVRHNCGHDGPTRNDLVLVTVRNTGKVEQTVEPVIVIDSRFPFSIIKSTSIQRALDRPPAMVEWKSGVAIGRQMSAFCTTPIEGVTTSAKQCVLKLGRRTLAPGRSHSFALEVAAGTPRRCLAGSYESARKYRDLAARAWKDFNLPFDRISVPDPAIQALLDSSIRNIFQAREIRNGLPAFQVGPTVYRGLWVVDGAFILEAATYLGLAGDARNGIEYLMTHQREDGGFMLLDKYWKESGIVLWAVTRHAQLTGDKPWLRRQWPKLERAVAFIGKLREEASKDPNALEYRLLPPGFPDGGLGNKDDPEYTNIYWTFAGMRAAIDAARWLGRTEQADGWQKEYDDFMAAFRKAAERDMRTDPSGNRYLPILMANKDNHLPQRAQWAFCHAIFPGQVFAKDDPLVRGNMAMLEAVERQGNVFGTGWMADGLWNYFASFYGHAFLWLGNGPKAGRVLYAFANHASPLLVWCEEQSLADAEKKVRHGDMPHNWASAEFIRLVRHLLVLERGKELHLFEGLPAAWAKPGMVVRVNKVLTSFGPISLELKIAPDGKSARLRLEPPRRDPPERIVVHLGAWADRKDNNAILELPMAPVIQREIPIQEPTRSCK